MQTEQHAPRTVLELLWRSFYLISLLILLYIFISHLVATVNPGTLFIDRQLFNSSYIRVLLGIGLLMGFNGWFILKSLKRMNYHSPWKLGQSEKIFTLSSAVILGYIYGGSLRFPSVISFAMFIGLSIGFVYLIPQLLNFYSYFTIHDFRYFIKTIPLTLHSFTALYRYIQYTHKANEKQYAFVITKKQIRIFLIICLSLVLIIVAGIIMTFITFKYLSGKAYRENLLSKTFYITAIKPPETTPARTVHLYGYNFAVKTDETYKVLSDDGLVLEIVSWDRDHIEFILPLTITNGTHEIWIVRPKDALYKKQGLVKSNRVPLKVHSRFALLPDADDTKLERGWKRIKEYLFIHYPVLTPALFYGYE